MPKGVGYGNVCTLEQPDSIKVRTVCGSHQREVRQGSRAFLLFVIIPPSICRIAFGGDKKQQKKAGRILEALSLNLEAP